MYSEVCIQSVICLVSEMHLFAAEQETGSLGMLWYDDDDDEEEEHPKPDPKDPDFQITPR